MCDRDKRQKNLMVIFNRSCCKIEDDLGIWCRGIQLEIRKNDKGTLHLGCGQLSRKNVPPSARAENCHFLKKWTKTLLSGCRLSQKWEAVASSNERGQRTLDLRESVKLRVCS